MRSRLALVALVALIAFTLACGPLSLGQQTSPTASPAVAQPTKPPAVPTQAAPTAVAAATKPAAAPTAAPTSAPLTDFGGLWADAQAKAKTAARYRTSMSWIIGATEDGKYAEQPFMVLEGYTVVTDTYQVFTAGLINEMLGGTKVEMMSVAGKSYMKGGAMFGLMDPNKWYLMPDSADSSPPLEPDDLFGMASPGTGSDAAKKSGTETVDGQSCDVWTWPFTNSAAFTGVVPDEDLTSDMSVVDKSETKSWLCKDGYVHKVAIEIAGHNKTNVNEKGAMKMETRMWDFGNPALVIKAPEGAIPFAQ